MNLLMKALYPPIGIVKRPVSLKSVIITLVIIVIAGWLSHPLIPKEILITF